MATDNENLLGILKEIETAVAVLYVKVDNGKLPAKQAAENAAALIALAKEAEAALLIRARS